MISGQDVQGTALEEARKKHGWEVKEVKLLRATAASKWIPYGVCGFQKRGALEALRKPLEDAGWTVRAFRTLRGSGNA